MPNWIPITIDTLYEAKIAALIDACSSAAKKAGQPDRVAGIIQGVVDYVRRKVGSCASNQVDADLTTIPKGLRDLTVDLIIARLKGALEEPLTDGEQKVIDRHEANLNRIAECKDVVDQPDTPTTPEVQGGPAVQLLRPTSTSQHPFRNLGAS
jgi:hypothetical protein